MFRFNLSELVSARKCEKGTECEHINITDLFMFHHILSETNNIRGSRHTGSVWKPTQAVRFHYSNSTAIKQSEDVQRKPFPVPPSQQVWRFRQTPSVGMYYLRKLAKRYII
jgi:hypothetical protein